MNQAGVLVVEDDLIVRRELVARIGAYPDLRVVAEVGSLRAARAAAAEQRAVLALVDLGLPDGDGTDLLRELRARQIASLVLTVSDSGQSVFRALAAGAGGYLLKQDAIETVGAALRSLRDGGAPISPRIARMLLDAFAVDAPAGSDPAAALTPREWEILEHFSSGATYAEVATLLGSSINTVRQHVRNMYDKLQVCSKTEAVVWAMSHRRR